MRGGEKGSRCHGRRRKGGCNAVHHQGLRPYRTSKTKKNPNKTPHSPHPPHPQHSSSQKEAKWGRRSGSAGGRLAQVLCGAKGALAGQFLWNHKPCVLFVFTAKSLDHHRIIMVPPPSLQPRCALRLSSGAVVSPRAAATLGTLLPWPLRVPRAQGAPSFPRSVSVPPPPTPPGVPQWGAVPPDPASAKCPLTREEQFSKSDERRWKKNSPSVP